MDELADRIDQLVPGLPEADRSVLAELPKIPQNEEPVVAGTAVLDEAVSTQTASMATIVAVPISAPLPPGSTVAMVAPTGDTSVATVALGTAGTFAGATVSMGSSRPSRHALVAAVCIGGAIGAVVLGVAFLLHGSSGVDARAGAEAVAPMASIAATNAPPPLGSAEPQAPEPSATAAVASPPESSAAAKPRAPKTTQPRQGTQQPAKDPPKSIDHGF